jgi:hypothetical protein
VDVSSLEARKTELLLAHASQAGWLDATQQINSYVATMHGLNREVGSMSGQFYRAEGWRQHSHLGLGPPAADPLLEALGDACLKRD